MIRLENNRADKLFLKEYFKEIEKTVLSMGGLDDLSATRMALEREFAKLIGTRFAMAVNSGTDALQLSLLALGIGPGDSVLIPDLTYISTALVVKYIGAQPIFIDAKAEDLTINENLIKKNIRPDTKAIVAVHMFGQPCAIEKIKKIARDNCLHLIEDACQALGSTTRSKPLGSFGDLAAFSFSYYKPLSSLGGNGGMIVFNKAAYAEKIDKYLNLWKQDIALLNGDRKFNRISLVDVATTKVKLKYLRQIISSRDRMKKMYVNSLSRLKPLTILQDPEDGNAVRENFPILAPNRDKLHQYLLKRGVKTELPYSPMHTLSLFKGCGCQKESFPVARLYQDSGLHLPLYSFMNENECSLVISSIKNFYKSNH